MTCPEIAAAARSFGGPLVVAVARGAHYSDPIGAPLRILAPVTGTVNSRRAAEIAVELARAARGALTILFVSPAVAASSGPERRRGHLACRNEEAAIKEIVELADRRDQPVRVSSRRSVSWHVGILEEAEL
jgi:nucleotide-binding universal stress UspA family protein